MIDELRQRLDETALRVHTAADAVDTAEPDADLEPLNTALDDAIGDAERAKADLAQAEQRAAARAAFPKPDPAETRKPAGDTKIVREERTYPTDALYGAQKFFRDAFLAKYAFGATEARERLERSQREFTADYRSRFGMDAQQRDVATSAFAGLVVPQYLTDLVAPMSTAGRPYLNTVRQMPLVAEGMTVNISRITTATSAAAQSADNAAVSETDIDDTLLTVNVRTYAGMQDLSRQTVERGTGTWEVTLDDLVRRYYAANDNGAINSDGTSGTHLSVRSTASIEAVTWTDASPTIAEFYLKLADAAQRINTNTGDIGAGATHVLMHPRRWGWLNGQSDSGGRPLVLPSVPYTMNPTALGNGSGYGNTGWSIPGIGLEVVTSSAIPTNLGTNEDIVIVYCAREQFYMEDPGAPLYFRYDEVGSGTLTVRMVVYGYSAFTAGRRPNSNATIGGSGLILPVF